ncbi:MAG: hypothetical protein FWC40_08880, partial [Proteobacteria bacterium]|nr:hypothetical protein [Pseudomonadota bacterium]
DGGLRPIAAQGETSPTKIHHLIEVNPPDSQNGTLRADAKMRYNVVAFLTQEFAMAKLNPNLTKAAKMAGTAAKVPKAPPMPKAPKAPTPDQLKKQAKAKAMARLKNLIKLGIFLLTIAIVALVVYLVKFHGKQPKDALKQAIEFAYKDNVLKFRDAFTTDSIEMVENGRPYSEEPWKRLMDGITPAARPAITKEKVETRNDIRTAEVTLLIDAEQRTIYMRQEEGQWKINLNVAINPRRLTLPDNIPPEYIENFQISDDQEAWWEDPPEEKEKKAKGGGWLSKLKIGNKRLF